MQSAALWGTLHATWEWITFELFQGTVYCSLPVPVYEVVGSHVAPGCSHLTSLHLTFHHSIPSLVNHSAPFLVSPARGGLARKITDTAQCRKTEHNKTWR
jgi:hypothetical protein